MNSVEIYKEKVSDLIKRIDKIILEDSDKYTKSNRIMKEFRKEYILLPYGYINGFLYSESLLRKFLPLPKEVVNYEDKNRKEEKFQEKNLYNKKKKSILIIFLLKRQR